MHARPKSQAVSILEGEGDLSAEPLSVLEVSYRRLGNAIMSGVFAPGEHIRQEDIASRLGISRGPAREALNRLAAEGFVTLRPRRGYVVASLDAAEVEDIFDIRMTLEAKAARIAAEKRTPADLKLIEKILIEHEQKLASNEASIEEISATSRRFHARIFECSGRANLCRIIANLRDSVEHYVRLSFVGRPNPSSDHREILRALTLGDGDLIADLSSAHCKRIGDSIIAMINSLETDKGKV